MRLKWMPWTFLVKRAARAGGFLDPVAVLGQLRRFAQPSEVTEPVELLRAGLVFHARGLINSRAIQHNLDWVWPYWIERQFDPGDESFIPRSFTVTHVNLTHRNWTALGLPGVPEMPLVDPRGLVTPFFDGWSLDAWVLAKDGRALFPSRLASVSQRLETKGNLAVTTECGENGLSLKIRSEVVPSPAGPVCFLRLSAVGDGPGWAVVSLRPCNPEGVSFVHRLDRLPDKAGWRVNGEGEVLFGASPERESFSRYTEGDVRLRLPIGDDRTSLSCEVGMATAAALFPLGADGRAEVEVCVPLRPATRSSVGGGLHWLGAGAPSAGPRWQEGLEGAAELRVPDENFQFLYEASLRTLVLLSPEEIYPGPYTYKRFWFRDAAFMLEALLCAGFLSRVRKCLDGFFPRQRRDGYFLSQEGEWDSNGEALWVLNRFCRISGKPPPPEWRQAVEKGAAWISAKRLKKGPRAGLFPAGFSAEHLGPNDHYYWDDFWGVAGLDAAAELLEGWGEARRAALRRGQAREFLSAVDGSLRREVSRLGRPAMPAAAGRRLDSGAIGGLAASHPLRLCAPGDPRLMDTVSYLMENHFFKGGFFHDVVHSGINPYLTLHIAQALLRAGDPRAFSLATAVAGLASPTGQWPEAIHPRTGGGCMGDGQHAWASAEWVMMMRNMFVREEEGPGTLVLASGIPDSWRRAGQVMGFGPAPTPYGPVTVTVRPTLGRTVVSWRGSWRGNGPRVEVRLPGCAPMTAAAGAEELVVQDAAMEAAP